MEGILFECNVHVRLPDPKSLAGFGPRQESWKFSCKSFIQKFEERQFRYSYIDGTFECLKTSTDCESSNALSFKHELKIENTWELKNERLDGLHGVVKIFLVYRIVHTGCTEALKTLTGVLALH